MDIQASDKHFELQMRACCHRLIVDALAPTFRAQSLSYLLMRHSGHEQSHGVLAARLHWDTMQAAIEPVSAHKARPVEAGDP